MSKHGMKVKVVSMEDGKEAWVLVYCPCGWADQYECESEEITRMYRSHLPIRVSAQDLL